jgi:hypothetical protein
MSCKTCPPLVAVGGHESQFNVAVLQRTNVLSLPALRSFGDLELHTLALLQAAETTSLDGREMHKYIFASLPADEAVALGVVKPLYCSLFCHLLLVSFSDYLRWCESEVLRAGLAGMQEAAQQPISFKRNFSIADQSTPPAGELLSKVTRRVNQRRNGSCPKPARRANSYFSLQSRASGYNQSGPQPRRNIAESMMPVPSPLKKAGSLRSEKTVL